VLRRLVVVLPLLLLTACAGGGGPRVPERPPPRPDDAVVVASFDFPESERLGELYAGALEGAGIPVRRELLLGPRELVGPALEQGLVDVVPEYLGTALAVRLPETPPAADAASTRRRLAPLLEEVGVRLLEPARAEDQNAVVVVRGTALVHGLRRISDLVEVASTFTFGGPPECPQRPFCLLGLREVYGLRFERFVPLDSGGPLTVAALRGSEVDVGLLFSTDPRLSGGGLVALEDDRGLQPAENVTPAVRAPVLERWGAKLSDALDAVSAALTTEGLRDLNVEVVLDGRPAREVAADWLARRDLR
jgi:osmoprotectant transport system substrate-binding protein